ncbi:DUF2147 domain-containing protein [Tianweitania sp. BSSL-BM11]|uniref:DUF2147 domain-containing protein n=1 Tax=Tianweitania aestuarii TaxID=2814886 RepID=A0ABS5RS90_9HYPH|nr:DUF2147 domain-containing protein [Tianweitania aestuarii]MBS9719920.1 DUF2147 domain-containing protein [Tianweitania aestuarii]
MKRLIIVSVLAMIAAPGLAFADDIEGKWKTDNGETAEIASCGKAFCITVRSGKYKGKQIGRMNADGDNRYSGEVTDPTNDKTYAGKATLSGNGLSMKGCVLGGLICRGQNWKRL